MVWCFSFVTCFSFYFWFLWICYMFLICGYDGVHVCWPMTVSACFKLIVIQVQIHFKRSSFILSYLMFCDFAVLFYIFMLILLLFIIVIIAFTLVCFLISTGFFGGLPWCLSGKESTCKWRKYKRLGFDLWVGRSLGEEMTTCSSILAWEIPWTEEHSGL